MFVIKKAIENGWDKNFSIKKRISVINQELSDTKPSKQILNDLYKLTALYNREKSVVGKSLLREEIDRALEEREKLRKNLVWIHRRYIRDDSKFKPVDKDAVREVSCEEIIQKKPVLASGSRLLYSSPLKSQLEDTPSFWVYTGTNSWYDFSLGIGGDVIELYMKLYMTDFKTAIKQLSEML